MLPNLEPPQGNSIWKGEGEQREREGRADGQAGGWAGKIERQRNKEIERRRNKEIERRRNKEIERLRGGWAGNIERQRNKEIERDSNKETERLRDDNKNP